MSRRDEWRNTRVVIDDAVIATGDPMAIIDPVWQQQRQAVVGSIVQIYERPFTIVGVYEPPGGARIKIPLAIMQDQEGADGRVSAVLIACVDPARQEEVAARIRERFPDDQIIFTRDLPEIYASGVPALNVFIEVVVAVAAAISMHKICIRVLALRILIQMLHIGMRGYII